CGGLSTRPTCYIRTSGAGRVPQQVEREGAVGRGVVAYRRDAGDVDRMGEVHLVAGRSVESGPLQVEYVVAPVVELNQHLVVHGARSEAGEVEVLSTAERVDGAVACLELPDAVRWGIVAVQALLGHRARSRHHRLQVAVGV